MRAILIDWLSDVHQEYQLRAETLFLAVQLTDRYLEKKAVASSKVGWSHVRYDCSNMAEDLSFSCCFVFCAENLENLRTRNKKNRVGGWISTKNNSDVGGWYHACG